MKLRYKAIIIFVIVFLTAFSVSYEYSLSTEPITFTTSHYYNNSADHSFLNGDLIYEMSLGDLNSNVSELPTHTDGYPIPNVYVFGYVTLEKMYQKIGFPYTNTSFSINNLYATISPETGAKTPLNSSLIPFFPPLSSKKWQTRLGDHWIYLFYNCSNGHELLGKYNTSISFNINIYKDVGVYHNLVQTERIVIYGTAVYKKGPEFQHF
jgi:hypothetical protein